ncbi:hypothetical protein J4050_09645 [Winogradskyella sp. DF17]|uniref:Uncharacterized protein n=1 Tax=Winogradskyella pelagia TaxID=2819984 RepID=A0ABS3T2Q0_9FLAO|nr:hypothetical protein [Winogradskyella sp. DF17]MBO3117012.1 hypothetical protein [Winogradskyella sp. DF17]
MKKVITICAFAIAMILGTQSAVAQMNKKDVNAIAAEKTEALRQQLKFDNEQRNEIYDVYKVYVQKKSSLRNTSLNNPSLEKLNVFRDEKFKLILTEAQFERYLKLKEE